MNAIAAQRVVLLPFPFSDLSASKLHPALVLADAGRGDWLLCQITSQPYADLGAVELTQTDFASGGRSGSQALRAPPSFSLHTIP